MSHHGAHGHEEAENPVNVYPFIEAERAGGGVHQAAVTRLDIRRRQRLGGILNDATMLPELRG
jgi:hypothetical protein